LSFIETILEAEDIEELKNHAFTTQPSPQGISRNHKKWTGMTSTQTQFYSPQSINSKKSPYGNKTRTLTNDNHDVFSNYDLPRSDQMKKALSPQMKQFSKDSRDRPMFLPGINQK
jgi:hypothetical protein